ncbi:ShET2/EspL2 family type III secretion system effector toxin [Candidatus Ichthyocystis sparus]|uniref:ShET2/EspL2 family type III secretion system effector toxin n=1 Tax=Candidatus Ichthyocystis sparus TaxID=1561004 RepID=UPI000B072517|nr:ShET2/EspL2 family type III secretion system effector toxin [Candidatus Ichthyocystis sparus]
MSTVNTGYHVHFSSHSMEIIPSDIRDTPYISKKYVSDSPNLNCAVEIDGKYISCGPLSLLFVINSIECYRSNAKLRVSELFSDEGSIKRSALSKLEEINENIVVKNSCDRHIIICDKFGDFLHKTASAMTCGEQRLFTLHSCNHVMSFKIMRKTKEIEGVLANKWVVHFFDPNKTMLIARSEVLSCKEFLDQSKFSLRMFIDKNSYRAYFKFNPEFIEETECAVLEYSDTREASLGFSTLETLSQDGISGCMIFHLINNNIYSLDIREIVKSKSFSTLSAVARKEIFFARSSSGVFALYLAMSQNKYNSIRSYNDFLEELSSDEQLSLLPIIIRAESPEGAAALFVAMQENSIQSINAFGSLIDRLMNIRSRMHIDNFCNELFDILLAEREDGSSAIHAALCKNNAGAIHAFGGLLDRIFILRDDVNSRRLADMIFNLLSHKDRGKNSALFFALANGHSDAVHAFGRLVDRLIVMKGYIPDHDVVSMIFELLESQSAQGIYGLYYALVHGHTDTVRAFSVLMDKLFIMRGHIPYTDIANMIGRLLMSSYNGVTGLFFALQEGHSDTIRAFSELMDKLFIMRGHIPDIDIADIVCKLLMSASFSGVTGLFFALQEGYTDTILAWGELIGKFFTLLSNCLPKDSFDSIMLNILEARDPENLPGIFIPLLKNNIDVMGAYSSLLAYASREVRRKIFCIKSDDGFPAICTLMSLGESEFFMACGRFLQSLSYDEQTELLPGLLISKNDAGDPALFLAMQEGHDSCISAYGIFLEEQLVKIKDRMSHDNFSNLISDIALAKRSDGMPALFIAMYKNRASTIEAYSALLDKISSLLKGTISDDKFARLIFELLKARTSGGIDGLFMALERGNTYSVTTFDLLLDRLLSVRGCIDDATLVGMVFDLLMCKSGADNNPGLFVAMQNGHHGAVGAFVKLLKKLMMFKDGVSTKHLGNMISDIIRSRSSNGMPGLFAALENSFPEVIKSYSSLLKLMPRDELVDVLLASDGSGRPAALFAEGEALEVYLEIISDLSTRDIYALHSQLGSARRTIEHILVGDRDLDGRYRLLLDKIKELARSSRHNV